MARGRHRRRSGLLSRLLPGLLPGLLPRRRRALAAQSSVQAELARLDAEVLRQRALSATLAETAVAALVRAARAEDLAAAAMSRAAGVEAELAGLRADLTAVREELMWAFAEDRLPADAPTTAVVDLRRGSRTA